jgi:hypothetical protein
LSPLLRYYLSYRVTGMRKASKDLSHNVYLVSWVLNLGLPIYETVVACCRFLRSRQPQLTVWAKGSSTVKSLTQSNFKSTYFWCIQLKYIAHESEILENYLKPCVLTLYSRVLQKQPILQLLLTELQSLYCNCRHYLSSVMLSQIYLQHRATTYHTEKIIYLTKLMKQGSSWKAYNIWPQLKLEYKFIYIPHILYSTRM